MEIYESIEKSFVYWNFSDVAGWFSAMEFPLSVINEINSRRISGIEIISLVNQRNLSEIGMTSKAQIQQLLWNIEQRIQNGDAMTGKAINHAIFQNRAGNNMLEREEQLVPVERKNTAPLNQSGKSQKQVINLINFGDDESSSELRDDAETVDFGEETISGDDQEQKSDQSSSATSYSPLVFDVRFRRNEPPHLLLEEFQPGNRIVVKDFPRRSNGEIGAAEQNGRIKIGDFVIAVNGVNLEGFPFQEAIRLLSMRERAVVLTFMRYPSHLVHHNFERWSMHALRSALMEVGIELTGQEHHKDVVNMVVQSYWDKPMLLPAHGARVSRNMGEVSMNGTDISGWLLVRAPFEKKSEVRFCALHESKLIYHRALASSNADQGFAECEKVPEGCVEMNTIKLVETTRTSEHGQKDLRLVDLDGQVWLLSSSNERALSHWHKRFLTAQIVGECVGNSGGPYPSPPTLEARTHNSLTISWLPPCPPYLNSVHSFQVQYKEGGMFLGSWHTASDEVHSTSLHIKGLKEGEKYVVRVRAMHDKDTLTTMGWGSWGGVSKIFVTEREPRRPTRPPVHLWVLVHGLKEDPSDMAYLGTQLEARHGNDSYVYLSEANAGAFKTLDGIDKGGIRLYEEIIALINRPLLQTLRKISFLSHGIGGLYVRYALTILEERGIFGNRLVPFNFVTFGTPHLGTLMSSAGMLGGLFEGRTSMQLQMIDKDEKNSRKPLLLLMCQADFLVPLERFPLRMVYTNVRFDSTEPYSSSLRLEDPYDGITDKELAERVTPQYLHILTDLDEIAEGIRAGTRQQRQIIRPFNPELAYQCGDRCEWENAAKLLLGLDWKRIDVYNPKGLNPHRDLIVATEWLNMEGTDIVRHCIDNVFT